MSPLLSETIVPAGNGIITFEKIFTILKSNADPAFDIRYSTASLGHKARL